MSLLTTRGITISANGQNYDYDYGLAQYQQKTSDWSDPDADVITDIRTWQDEVEAQTGTRPTRAVCRQQVMAYLYKNNLIRNAIWGNDSTAPTSREKVRQYIKAETNLTIVEYEKQFIDEAGQTKKYVPADTFVMFPEGSLGTGWFGTTPEQSDLMTGSAANVTITDVGVAVTTMKKYDPVNVDTKVSMIYLPSFERIPEILIASVGH
jgi:hypothetical protein